jgi:UDP-N-acetylglucosamine 4,6-dehydratase/5-epimerase
MFEDKKILITGGTGTFGKAFISFCEENNLFKKIIVFSRDEYKQFIMKKWLDSEYPSHRVNFIIGDVRDESRLITAFKDVDFVVNAAALKHVPVCEYNPQEAAKTNVDGAINICKAANSCNVKKVIQLSTDKAAEPINFYGATKMMAEKFMINYNHISSGTRYSCVRYGNILGSRGSILELFREWVDNDVTPKITHNDMTRFWMNISDAVRLVLWSLENTIGGEIVVPKIRSSRVVDIMTAFYESIGVECIPEVSGIRPGEKLHEQLLTRVEVKRCFLSDCNKYYIVYPDIHMWDAMLLDKYREKYSADFVSNLSMYESSQESLILTKKELVEIVKKQN